MSVGAPAAAVTSALVPLAFTLLRGESVATQSVFGALVGLVAFVLVSLAPGDGGSDTASTRRVLLLALLGGIGFGVFFVAVSRSPEDAGMWPLVSARIVSVTALSLWAVRRGRRLFVRSITVGRLAVVAGVGDVLANASFLVASRHGSLAVVAVLGSMYPAVTVLLARSIDRETLRPVQVAGLGLALAAVALIAAA
jgi:drug/metabolite transporter (DMT)-like permease